MEDPWANAWSQPETLPEKPPGRSSRGSNEVQWAVESSEADVGEPSWTTGGIEWNQPSGQVSLWRSATVDSGFEDRYSGWNLKVKASSVPKEVVEETEDDIETSYEEIVQGHDSSIPTSSKSPIFDTSSSPLPHLEAPSPFKTTSPVSSENPQITKNDTPTDDIDTFGMFETGAELATDPDESWGSSYTFDDVNSSSQPWDAPTTSENKRASESLKDEWEIAKELKLQRDRRVPPEIIEILLGRWNELFDELEKNKPSKSSEDCLSGSWRGGLKYIEESSLDLERLLRDRSFQPPMHFSKTSVAKAMANSLKLSKNTVLAQSSPMSHLFAAKYSAAWELSVKSKVLAEQAETAHGQGGTPMGPNSEINPTVTEKKSSASGGILSFWSRRKQSSQSSIEIKSIIAEDKNTVSPIVTLGSASPRPSLDFKVKSDVERASTPSSILTVPSLLSENITTDSSSTKVTLPSPTISLVSPTAESVASFEQQHSSSVATAPSAVSRFFNRFSRSRTSTGSISNSPRGSMALSTDDINFLSDIVPSANDDEDPVEHGLVGLTNMISSAPLPDKLPPLLPQPPRVSQKTPSPALNDRPVYGLSPLNQVILGEMESFSDFVSSPTHELALSPSDNSTHSLLRQTSPTLENSASLLSGLGFSEEHLKGERLTTAAIAPPPSTEKPLPFANFPSSQISTPPILSPPRHHALPVSNPQGSYLSQPPSPQLPNTGQSNFNIFDGEDDFSEFRSASNSALKPSKSAQSADNSFTSSFTDANLLTHSTSTPDNSFGDFGEFMYFRPSLSTPSPPRPPRKPSPPNQTKTVYQRRTSQAADHAPTIDLMQKAAQRPGRWPAPPSPLPTTLPPPPSYSSTAHSPNGATSESLVDSQTVEISWSEPDFFNTPKLLPPSSFLSPTIPNHIPQIGQSPDLDNLSLFVPPSKQLSTSNSKQTSQAGGLSAQDLSFFEGL